MEKKAGTNKTAETKEKETRKRIIDLLDRVMTLEAIVWQVGMQMEILLEKGVITDEEIKEKSKVYAQQIQDQQNKHEKGSGGISSGPKQSGAGKDSG